MSDLRTALDALLASVPPKRLTESVQRLIADYRSGKPAESPLLRSMVDATAYAAYRMPATHAAVARALAEAPDDLDPRSLLDVGGGTGAATWAALERFPQLQQLTVFDQVPQALELGRRLLPRAVFEPWRLHERPLPPADLITVSYVLGELTEADQHALVDAAGGAARQALVIVEPGTPLGYRRILGARTRLMDLGWTVAAPCPHQLACGMTGRDWCHFAARINRSALHRQIKDAELSYEDEKFSYLVLTKNAKAPQARVVRHPLFRKGLVSLQLCSPDTSVGQQTVSKREGERYKRARDVAWGDPWE